MVLGDWIRVVTCTSHFVLVTQRSISIVGSPVEVEDAAKLSVQETRDLLSLPPFVPRPTLVRGTVTVVRF